MSKKGQFYLIAAVVIVAAIAVFVSVLNYHSNETESNIEEIAEELEYEGVAVLNYGTFSDLENFLADYSGYLGSEYALYVVMGTSGNLDSYEYANGVQTSYSHTGETGTTTLTVEENDYSFDVHLGKNFYFVLTKEIGEAKYVETN